MKTTVLFSSVALLAGGLIAADAPKDEVAAAAKKLAESPNYSWKQTVAVPEGSRFRPGPTEGQTQKDGLMHVTMRFGDNETHAFVQGDKGAFTDQDGAWMSLAEAEDSEGGPRFTARMVSRMRTPAAQAQELLEGTKELKKVEDAYQGEMTPKAVEEMLTFRGAGGSTVKNPEGMAKFWIKDGILTKYEYKVKGTVSRDGNDRDTERTTTVEIKDIGTTKLNVPAAAKRKLT